MTNTQFFSVFVGGWIIFLALLAWALFQRKARPGSLKWAMLGMGLITATAVFARSPWMSVFAVSMAIVGALMGEVAGRQWKKSHKRRAA